MSIEQMVSGARRVLRLRAVLERTGRSRSSWYEDIAAGRAPRPIPIGPKARGWLEHEIDGYIGARIEARDAAAQGLGAAHV